MNILFVSTDYPKRGQVTTGFPNYLYRVSLALVQLGHKPIILASGMQNMHWIEQEIEIYIVYVPEYRSSKAQVINYLMNALCKGYFLNRKVVKMLGEKQIDVVQFTSLQGIAFFYRGNVPAILRLSSYAKTAFSSFQTYSPLEVQVMSFLERCSAARCNAIFAPCRKNAQIFGSDCRRNVKVIESPFVNDVLDYDYRYVDLLKNKKYVLFFGSLYAEKGILVIAEILEKFLDENPDYYFLFIGKACSINGRSAARILWEKAGKNKKRVLIWDALSHKYLYPIIEKADFIVLPSLMENLSNACIEAMYLKKVVIGTEGASFEQLITHGKSGLLCKIGDSNDLLEKMQIAVSLSEGDKIHMGNFARRRVDRLKPEYVVKKLVRLYSYVIENTKKCI